MRLSRARAAIKFRGIVPMDYRNREISLFVDRDLSLPRHGPPEQAVECRLHLP